MGRWNLMRMCEDLEMINLKKGAELNFSNKDKKVVYFLKKGSVKIVSSPNNHTKHVIKRGNIFGELSLFQDDDEQLTDKAVVLEDSTTVCFIEVERMKALMEKHKSLRNGLIKLNGFNITKLERKLEHLLYKDSETRIKEYIFDYINEFGELKNELIEAKNLLSHTDIANLTNTSRQTVSNVMSKLRKNNVLSYDSKTITLLKG